MLNGLGKGYLGSSSHIRNGSILHSMTNFQQSFTVPFFEIFWPTETRRQRSSMGQYSVFGAPKLLSFYTRPHVNVLLVSKHRTCRTFKVLLTTSQNLQNPSVRRNRQVLEIDVILASYTNCGAKHVHNTVHKTVFVEAYGPFVDEQDFTCLCCASIRVARSSIRLLIFHHSE